MTSLFAAIVTLLFMIIASLADQGFNGLEVPIMYFVLLLLFKEDPRGYVWHWSGNEPTGEPSSYYAVVTTGGMRFIAWEDDGAFVTRLADGTLHRFDNVACCIELPAIPGQSRLNALARSRARKQNKEVSGA